MTPAERDAGPRSSGQSTSRAPTRTLRLDASERNNPINRPCPRSRFAVAPFDKTAFMGGDAFGSPTYVGSPQPPRGVERRAECSAGARAALLLRATLLMPKTNPRRLPIDALATTRLAIQTVLIRGWAWIRRV